MASSPNQPIGYGLTLKEPTLYDVFSTWKRNIFLSFNCVKVGRILEFNPATHTANVDVAFLRVLNDGTTTTYPTLQNCPVFTLQGGGASVQFPIKKDDTCLVLFSDRNLDAWYQNGGQQVPFDARLHDLSDAIVLVGLNWSEDTTIPPVSTTEARFILADGLTKVGLEAGKITIQNGPLPAQSLKGILDTFFTALSTANSFAAINSAAAAAQITLDLLLY